MQEQEQTQMINYVRTQTYNSYYSALLQEQINTSGIFYKNWVLICFGGIFASLWFLAHSTSILFSIGWFISFCLFIGNIAIYFIHYQKNRVLKHLEQEHHNIYFMDINATFETQQDITKSLSVEKEKYDKYFDCIIRHQYLCLSVFSIMVFTLLF